ncbi:MAG TPA: hypothetical protein VK846_17405 [Candidatus Limnocylindria bacterium]|nr:hypothetical protein [Candidatus Limnocylindria bacterium]
MSEKKIWFPAKKYGRGWGPPHCWQGWLVLAAWFLLLQAGIPLALRSALFFVAYTVFLSTILIIVCWLKGEKPRWRWGKE